jgi:transcriptional regulator with XRE-family HTH domain
MIQRILEIMKVKGLTPSQFADEIGVQRSGISHLMSGRNNPSLEFITKVLEKFPDVSAEWLVRGTGNRLLEERFQPAAPEMLELPFPEPAVIRETAKPVIAESAPPAQKRKKTVETKPAERVIIIYPDDTFRELIPE